MPFCVPRYCVHIRLPRPQGMSKRCNTPRVEWLPVVGGTPNFLERITVFSPVFPSAVHQSRQIAGANAGGHRSFRRSGFAPFASKINTLTGSSATPSDRLKQSWPQMCVMRRCLSVDLAGDATAEGVGMLQVQPRPEN